MGSDPIRIDVSGFTSAGKGEGSDGGKAEPPRHRSVRSLLLKAVGLILLAALPFLVLIRGSVFLHQHMGLSGWSSVLGGVLVTILLLLLYLVGLSLRLGHRGRVPRLARRATVVLVVAYSVYALVYLSGTNVKSEAVRETYAQLTPVLRVAVSTLLLVDRNGVLTSAGRSESDYEAWGLPVNERSLHLPQEDGYVYAVDVRTMGRREWQNTLVRGFFQAMGFETLRHVGTADHLHVSLRPTLNRGSTP